MLTTEQIKMNVGRYAADLVPNDSIIGLGTGSTVYWLIQELGIRIQQGLVIKAVPTSATTKELADKAGIKIVELNEVNSLALTIDGADEIDPHFQLIKGGGGALLQEKMVAAASNKLIIIADENKYVEQLGHFPLPVEVIPSGWKQVQQKILSTGCSSVTLRQKNDQSFITDNGHYILDCYYEKIINAAALNISLHLLPGVVETGLFINMADIVIIGYANGRIQVMEK